MKAAPVSNLLILGGHMLAYSYVNASAPAPAATKSSSLILQRQPHLCIPLQLLTLACPLQLHMQMLQNQHQQRQQATQQQQQQQQPQQQQQHQLPGAGPSVSFAPEADSNTEGETSRRKQRAPVWARKQQVIEQINELIDELDEIDANIALQVGCTNPRDGMPLVYLRPPIDHASRHGCNASRHRLLFPLYGAP